MKVTGTILLAITLLSLTKAQEGTNDQVCPKGQLTKEAPSPEPGLKACKQYQCNSCCTEELTEQLALVPLQMVGALNYSQCDGGLSTLCSQYTSYIQCFYQCSPNIYPWLSNIRTLQSLPVCSSFCDSWYDACKNDRTCVDGTNWKTGFQVVKMGDKSTLQCKTNAPCRTYSEIYKDAELFCTEMWPGMVTYETDEAKCITPGDQAHNEPVVKAKEGEDAPFSLCEEVQYTDTGMIIGIVVGVIAGLAMIAALSIYIYRKKQAKDHKKSKAESKPKEMEELNPATLE